MSTEWKTVSDVTHPAVYPPWISPYGLAALFASLLAMAMWFGTRRRRKPGLAGMVPAVAVVVACFMTGTLALVAGKVWWGYRWLHADGRADRCTSVSGTVQVRWRKPAQGPSAPELLEAGATQFRLAGDSTRAGFESTTRQGPPLRQGVTTRLHNCPESGRNVIARVDYSASRAA